MMEWWVGLSSFVRLHAWAQVLGVLLLVLAVGAILRALKASSRKPEPNSQGAPARPPAPAVQVPAPAPAVPDAPPPAQPAARVEAPPSPLTAEVRAHLLALLRARPTGRVSLSSIQDDAQAQADGAELAGVLAEAGWETVRLGPMPDFPGARGIHFMIRNAAAEPEHARHIIHSFIEAGLRPSTELNQALKDDTLLLVVGHR